MPKAMEEQIIDHYNRYDESERLKHDIGPPEQVRTQEVLARYRASSPITYVEQLKAPRLIIPGRNDTRTPRPMEVYEQKLRLLGKPLEMHWYDAGHSGAGVERDIQDCEIMLRFAYRVLGEHLTPGPSPGAR